MPKIYYSEKYSIQRHFFPAFAQEFIIFHASAYVCICVLLFQLFAVLLLCSEQSINISRRHIDVEHAINLKKKKSFSALKMKMNSRRRSSFIRGPGGTVEPLVTVAFITGTAESFFRLEGLFELFMCAHCQPDRHGERHIHYRVH